VYFSFVIILDLIKKTPNIRNDISRLIKITTLFCSVIDQ
jgi:hypothetical protein